MVRRRFQGLTPLAINCRRSAAGERFDKYKHDTLASESFPGAQFRLPHSDFRIPPQARRAESQ